MRVIEHHDELLERLASVVEHDAVLARHVDTGWMWQGDSRVLPSGPDKLACALARSVIARRDGALAVTLPRGTGPLPALLGLYLMLWRKVLGRQNGRMCGSVAVSTRRTALRELARKLRFDGSELDAEGVMPVARLVGLPAANRVKAAALTLDRKHRMGLSQNDSFLLFQLPNIAPPVALNVISAMVVDTAGASVGSWEQTWERNVAAHRRQVWVGELGDEEFEVFCAQRDLPLVRLHWPLLAAADHRWGDGASGLAGSALARRARQLPGLAYRPVAHEEVEHYLRELSGALAEMRAYARTDGPQEVMYAAWAGSLLARLAVPLRYYEHEAAALPRAITVKWLCDRVEQISSTPFRGRWKPAYRTHWPVVCAALARLRRLTDDLDDGAPKWWALADRVMGALADGQQVRILCQSRGERAAVRAALNDQEVVGGDDLARLDIRSFSERAPHGPADGVVTLLTGPPGERFADIYLSGEHGQMEVLCYGHEVGRLRGRLRRAWEHATSPAANNAALAKLDTGAALGDAPPATEFDAAALVVELDGYDADARYTPSEDDPAGPRRAPDADAEFWERAPELLGTELEGEESKKDSARTGLDDTGPGGGGPNLARLVTFADAPPMYFAQDVEVTVVIAGDGGEADVTTMLPGALEPGMSVAVLPGAARGSLLAELMAAWDEQLELVRRRYEPMYRRALQAAVERLGVPEVARRCKRTPEAVRGWLSGWAWPGDRAALKALLEAAGDEQAIRSQAVIQAYFNKVRGTHRIIGRVLNDAVGETVVRDRGGEHIQRLQELVGVELIDLFDNTHVLRITAVSEPRQVPAGVCGSFLDRDDPYLQAKDVTL